MKAMTTDVEEASNEIDCVISSTAGRTITAFAYEA